MLAEWTPLSTGSTGCNTPCVDIIKISASFIHILFLCAVLSEYLASVYFCPITFKCFRSFSSNGTKTKCVPTTRYYHFTLSQVVTASLNSKFHILP